MGELLTGLTALAAVGLAASVVVHACAWLGIPNPFGPLAWTLHVGIFVVWLPAILATNKSLGNFSYKRNDFWAVALAGCPPWMTRIVMGFFYYAIANFAVFFLRSFRVDPKHMDPSVTLQGFSGHWMAFYAAAIGLLCSAAHRVDVKCSNGHSLSPAAKFCESCGAPASTGLR
jgi:hypothetical protein